MSKRSMTVFGLRLRESRQHKGLTLKELGAKVGAVESTMSLYETGKRWPDHETLLKMAEILDVSLDYLLGRAENGHFLPLETVNEAYRKFSKELIDAAIWIGWANKALSDLSILVWACLVMAAATLAATLAILLR